MKNIQAHLGLKNEKFDFRTGDTVKVHTKVVEGDSERIQIFDGVVVSRRGAGIAETITVRKISYGVGVERIFPINSPRIDKIEVIKTGKVQRSKIYYLRKLAGKSARLKETAQKDGSASLNNSFAGPRPFEALAKKDGSGEVAAQAAPQVAAVPAAPAPAAAPASSDVKATN